MDDRARRLLVVAPAVPLASAPALNSRLGPGGSEGGARAWGGRGLVRGIHPAQQRVAPADPHLDRRPLEVALDGVHLELQLPGQLGGRCARRAGRRRPAFPGSTASAPTAAGARRSAGAGFPGPGVPGWRRPRGRPRWRCAAAAPPGVFPPWAAAVGRSPAGGCVPGARSSGTGRNGRPRSRSGNRPCGWSGAIARQSRQGVPSDSCRMGRAWSRCRPSRGRSWAADPLNTHASG